MNENPFFSIIVPVYKVERYLDQCVQSVLSQTYENFELILVDDGSPDNCPKLCDGYAAVDARIRVIHKENGGAAEARNHGLDIAVGEYILFLDSDDYWCDTKALQYIANRVNSDNLDVLIWGYSKFFQRDDKFIGQNLELWDENCTNLKKLIDDNIFVACAWDKAVRRTIILENRMRFVPGQVGEDIEWCFKLISIKPRIGIAKQCFNVYRQQNATSVTSNMSRKNIIDVFEIIRDNVASNEKNRDLNIYNFAAIQYVLLLTITNYVRLSDIDDIVPSIKEMLYLLNYSQNKKVLLVSKFKFLGFRGIRKLLGLYKKYK